MAKKHNPIDPYAVPAYRKMKSGALVRYAIFAVLGIVAVGGAFAIMNMPTTSIGEKQEAAISEPTPEDYAAAAANAPAITEDGAPAEAAATPAPEAAPPPAREARVAPRPRSRPTAPPPEVDLNAAAEPKPLAPPAFAPVPLTPDSMAVPPAAPAPIPATPPVSPNP